jgi:hypothetical protein
MEKGIRGGDRKAMEKRRKGDGEKKYMEKGRRWRKDGDREGKEMEKGRRWRRVGYG